jgi:hypothetical protein
MQSWMRSLDQWPRYASFPINDSNLPLSHQRSWFTSQFRFWRFQLSNLTFSAVTNLLPCVLFKSMVLTIYGFGTLEISTLKLRPSPNTIIWSSWSIDVCLPQSTTAIPSGLQTSENSTFNLHFPSKCADFCHTSSWIGWIRFTSGLHLESTDFHPVSLLIWWIWFTSGLYLESTYFCYVPSRYDGPYLLQTSGFGNLNSQLKPKWFYLKFMICYHASLWIWRSRFTPDFRFQKFQFSIEIFETIFPKPHIYWHITPWQPMANICFGSSTISPPMCTQRLNLMHFAQIWRPGMISLHPGWILVDDSWNL